MRQPIITALTLSLSVAALVIVSGQAEKPDETAPPPASAVQKLQVEAEALAPLVKSPIAVDFLKATAHLQSIEPRMVYRDKSNGQWLSAQAAEALPNEQRDALQQQPINESIYYNTFYGTPLAYSRVLELAGEYGVGSLAGKKILDFGYGTIGHLRLMACCGAETVGLDVDSFLTALYSNPADQGPVNLPNAMTGGSVKLISGRLSDEHVRTALGGEFDLITSKNTLKRGYINPPANVEIDKRMLINLGLDDAAFVRAIFDMLKPGGAFIIYNLSPKPAAPGEKFIPMADGRCPFDQQLLEKAGFKVLAYDRNDDAAARAMAAALGWDKSMDIEEGLFAHVTVMVKP